ncbi:MAG: hypothetical protein IPI49_18420 [Myxococcales bacterium]|nr:hypothetical protein [Myxococcales bacterium]
MLGWPAIYAANAALPLTSTTGQCRWRGERVDSWDAAATITSIQRRADAAAAPATSAPAAPPTAASLPPTFPRTPSPPLIPRRSPARPRRQPLRGRWDDYDRHSALERWVLAEMEATGVDPISVGRPLPDHLQHPSQRPSLHQSPSPRRHNRPPTKRAPPS